VITAIALAALLHALPAVEPPADKLKHFFLSAFIQSAVFSASRAAGMNRGNAQLVAGVSTMSAGVWKEINDRRRKGAFSRADLAWDAAGALAAASLLNGTR
jgi:uncharacterized protein YfiM (DUF2279 family)